MIKYLLLIFFLFDMALVAETKTERNSTVDNASKTSIMVSTNIQELLLRREKLNQDLLINNIWSKIYSNYHTYQELRKQNASLESKIFRLSKKSKRTLEDNKDLEDAKRTKSILVGKLQQLEEYKKDPFKKFLTPPSIKEVPSVTNPFAVISALSYQEKLNSDQQEYINRYMSLERIVDKLKEKEEILNRLLILDVDNYDYIEENAITKDKIKTFTPIIEIFKTTQNVYTKKIDEIKLNLQYDIKREMEKASIIGGIILFLIVMTLLVKYLVRRYMSNNDRFYTINKVLNFTFFTLLVLTLLGAYIENVSYLVTILGFASAGIAIAMKDWFMSLMGWFTIVIGGAIHVGDRVKFVKDGVEYVGDIVDVSMLRMTMQEDVTLTTYTTNRRAGRIIFIPNNFIFTDMIANYSHAGLKTVWDGIDFVITFDSDFKRAAIITKEITKKYSKGYTDITRKQLNKLRSQYHIKNTNVEPRILTFFETYGIKISAWYLTNSYATLTLRSTITSEIILSIQEEENISLAFPTQSIYIDKSVPKPQLPDLEEDTATERKKL